MLPQSEEHITQIMNLLHSLVRVLALDISVQLSELERVNHLDIAAADDVSLSRLNWDSLAADLDTVLLGLHLSGVVGSDSLDEGLS